MSIYNNVKHKQFELNLVSLFATNLLSSIKHVWSALYSLVLFRTSLQDLTDQSTWLADMMHLQRSVVDAQSASANQSLLALLPNKTYLRPCERTLTLYETRPLDASKQQNQANSNSNGNSNSNNNIDSPEYFVSKCNCSSWYVYDFVPKTNLIMLIVNTTSACRKCSEPATPASSPGMTPLDEATSNSQPPPALQVSAVPAINSFSNGNGNANGNGNGYGNGYGYGNNNGLAGNKTAEDQVCVMLEKEAQLYVKKPENCYSIDATEAEIHICGGSPKSAPINLNLIATCCTLLSLFVGWFKQIDLHKINQCR